MIIEKKIHVEGKILRHIWCPQDPTKPKPAKKRIKAQLLTNLYPNFRPPYLSKVISSVS